MDSVDEFGVFPAPRMVRGSSGFYVWLVLPLLLFSTFAAAATERQDVSSPGLRPESRIELSATLYREPSRVERLSEDTANESVDFLDADHVLLTSNPRTLFKRPLTCPPSHDDRIVHAVVLRLPDGKVVKEANWYLHDHARYLWSLGSGAILLRRASDLYRVDSNLQEKLVLHSPRPLLWVSVTPDKTQVLVETEVPAAAIENDKGTPASSLAKPEPAYQIEFFDTRTFARQRKVQFKSKVNLEATSAGYADSVHKGDVWLIRFGPSPEERHNIARVRSRTVPRVFYSGNNSLLVGRCATVGCDYSVTSFTINGRRLWRQSWSQFRTFPVVERSSDGSRFAVSSLRHATGSGPSADSAEETAPGEGMEQEIRVSETAGGTQILSLDVHPAVMNGQNFAFSPDGRRLVVLQDSGLDFFSLPEASPEEQKRFAAVRAEALDSYTLDPDPEAADLVDPRDGDDSSEAADQIAIKLLPKTAAAGSHDAEAAGHAPASASPTPGATGDGPTDGEPDAHVPTFKVTTKNVAVDIVVTDSKGHPIKGLQEKDFHLTEDGHPQTINSFHEFAGIGAHASTPAEPVPAKKPNVFWNETQTADEGPATMILFDVLNTPTADQSFAREQLVRYLESRTKGSLLALCMLSAGESSLRLLQGFTPNENILIAAVKGRKGTPRAVRWQEEKVGTQAVVNTIGELNQEGRGGGWQNLLQGMQNMQAAQERTDTDTRVGITLESLTMLGRYLSGFRGRKNLIWLSGSFPISLPTSANGGSLTEKSRDYLAKVKQMTNLLAEAQVAVYPIDVRGLMVGNLAASEKGLAPPPVASSTIAGAASANGLAGSSLQAAQEQAMNAFDQERVEHETMTEIAVATGGKATYNSNGIEMAIATAIEQGSNYYTLAYNPANREFNGKFRKIKIALAEPGYTLHYRQGYFAADATSTRKNAEQTRTRSVIMQHGSPPAHQIHFSAHVVPLGGKKKIDRAKLGDLPEGSTKASLPATVEVQRYGIDYTVPTSELRFTPAGNGQYRSALVLLVASSDAEGSFLSWRAYLGNSTLDAATYRELSDSNLRVHQEVQIPTDAISMRLGIQDRMSDQLGSLEIALPVPPDPDAPKQKPPLPEIEPD